MFIYQVSSEAVYLASHYNLGLVILSIIVAIFAAFVALDLLRRVQGTNDKARRLWLAGGAFSMGTGIWSMHFIAMLAFKLPVPLGFSLVETAVPGSLRFVCLASA